MEMFIDSQMNELLIPPQLFVSKKECKLKSNFHITSQRRKSEFENHLKLDTKKKKNTFTKH